MFCIIDCRARWSVTEQAAEENDKRRRETKKAVESNGESSGRATEQWRRAMNKRH
ncbi:unnamed protein product [Brassica oleracea var. botrytis]